MTSGDHQTLAAARAWARHWLFNHALPLWWEAGADHSGGGYFEKLDQQGRPVGVPTRVRVQARQLYVFAEAGRLGWSGPWRVAMQHALSFMLQRYPRSDGLFRSTLGTADEKVDLYDQAFVLFALAHAYQQCGQDKQLLAIARTLLSRLDEHLAHSLGGYEEANPRQLPLRSNPQMHLLEAFLAWVDAGVEEPCRDRALSIVQLAKARLIDPRTGAIGEYFDGNWGFAPQPEGSVREPGHQFEWAYLLRWSQRVLELDLYDTAAALEAFGSRFGIDACRHVAVFSVNEAGVVIDAKARLWAQTERLRASLVLASTAGGSEQKRLQRGALESFQTLRCFLDTPLPGLWREWMEEDGTFRQEASPASSLYHIVSALAELDSAAF